MKKYEFHLKHYLKGEFCGILMVKADTIEEAVSILSDEVPGVFKFVRKIKLPLDKSA